MRHLFILFLLLGICGCQPGVATDPDPQPSVSGPPLPDFAQTKDSLLLRLGPEEWPRQLPGMLSRSDLPGTVTTVVIDSLHSVRTLTADDAKTWGKSPEALFDIAFENLKKQNLPKMENLEIGDDISVLALADDSYFLAGQTLLMEKHPQWQGPHGCLLAIPRRDTLLVYPVQDSQVLSVLNLLPTICRKMHDQGPGPISPDIFYYDGTSFQVVSVEESEGILTVKPPANLMQTLLEIPKTKHP